MKWAFWRRRKSKNSGSRRADGRADRGAQTNTDSLADAAAGEPADAAGQAEQLRARARRRLIGAAVLLLGAAVFVPIFLDPAPRPLPDNIPIDIPSDRAPFAPRLSLPAEPSSEATTRETPDRPAEPAVQDVQDSGAPTAPTAQKDAGKPAGATAAAATPDASLAAHWVVQAAALSSQTAAHRLAERLAKAGLAPFVEKADGADGTVYRVRLGPYPSKDGAARMKRRLQGLGVESTVVRVEGAAR